MNKLTQTSELNTLDVSLDRVPKQTLTLEQYRQAGGNVVRQLAEVEPPTQAEVRAARAGVNKIHVLDLDDPREPRVLAKAKQVSIE